MLTDASPRTCLPGAIAAVLCLLVPVSAAAQGRSTLTAIVENDSFVGEDNNYTNGTKVIYNGPRGEAPRLMRNLATRLPMFPEPNEGIWTAGYALGINFYTSSDISDPNPPLTDHPYAGWLHSEIGVVADSETHVDSLQLSLGVVGPASLAEEAQDLVHEILDREKAEGWDTQLSNEPAFFIGYERRWRYRGQGPYGLDVEHMPSAGAALGNVYTYGALGYTFRIGHNLPADTGVSRIQPGNPIDGAYEVDGWSAYLFAGGEGRVVGRDIFLDGNTFEDSREVDKNTLVGDLLMGGAIVFDRVRLSYSHVLRSERFENATGDDSFGSLAFSVRF